MSSNKVLTEGTINPKVLETSYAVRGEVVQRAGEYAAMLEKERVSGQKTLPFDEIIYCNIGNPQQVGQQPITFIRQVVSLCMYPELLANEKIAEIYPADAIERAQHFIAEISGGVGAYSDSRGLAVVRESIQNFLEKRDGFPVALDDIFCSDGASPSVQRALQILIRDNQDGIMIPIPQYPLYSATIPLLGGAAVPYYLDEKNEWGLEVSELKRSIEEARKKGINPRALVIINPGNPTGQCLSIENIEQIVDFCRDEKLVLCADEVYQENLYIADRRPFHSFREVLLKKGASHNDVELLSFHSTSKGFVGECGLRGGYCNTTNIDESVKAQMYKLASINLCPNVIGQLTMAVKLNPPSPGSPSYELYQKESTNITSSLQRRAETLVTALNKLEGVTCNAAQGAMYAFPQITLSPKAVAAAEAAGKKPDTFYVLELLKETGIVVVSGSGFGQVDGTWHFRTTFLPQEDKIDAVVTKLATFHEGFIAKYQ